MIDSAPRWSSILLDAAGKQEIVSCQLPVVPLGVLVGERNCQAVPAPEATSNCFGTGRKHKLNLL
jgi:hypothetical protein